MGRSIIGGRGATLALFALVATACSPAVPDLADVPGDAATVVSTTSAAGGTAPTTTTAVPSQALGVSATGASSSSATSTTSTTTPTATAAPDESPPGLTVGPWTLADDTRDESGTAFTATVIVPTLRADVDPVLLGRIATRIEGQVESQIGSTLALWRSIEAQGSHDMSGSSLRLEFDVAGFDDDFISMRFFSDERIGDSGGALRRATTLMMDLTSGFVIGFDDIVVGEESRDALLSLVQARLLEGFFDGDAEAFALWAGNLTAADLDQVALTPAGLEVWFDELEVGPPGIGMPAVTIAYDSLSGIVDPRGPAARFTS